MSRPTRRRRHRLICSRHERRPALEQRQRNVHRGRAQGDIIVRGTPARRRRCERRRAARSLRRRVRRHAASDRILREGTGQLSGVRDCSSSTKAPAVSTPRRLASILRHSLGAVFSDMNGDGFDLYIANDETRTGCTSNYGGKPASTSSRRRGRQPTLPPASRGQRHERRQQARPIHTNCRQTEAAYENNGLSHERGRSLCAPSATHRLGRLVGRFEKHRAARPVATSSAIQ